MTFKVCHDVKQYLNFLLCAMYILLFALVTIINYLPTYLLTVCQKVRPDVKKYIWRKSTYDVKVHMTQKYSIMSKSTYMT